MGIAKRDRPAPAFLRPALGRENSRNGAEPLGFLKNVDAATNQPRQLATELGFQQRPPLEEALDLVIGKRNLQPRLFPVSD